MSLSFLSGQPGKIRLNIILKAVKGNEKHIESFCVIPRFARGMEKRTGSTGHTGQIQS